MRFSLCLIQIAVLTAKIEHVYTFIDYIKTEYVIMMSPLQIHVIVSSSHVIKILC